MRPVEVKHLRRCDVDLVKRLVRVRRSKNETSHRVIPLNASAIEAAARMFERADLLGHTEPEQYLWPACQWGRYDATKPMLKWDTACASTIPGTRSSRLESGAFEQCGDVPNHLFRSRFNDLAPRECLSVFPRK